MSVASLENSGSHLNRSIEPKRNGRMKFGSRGVYAILPLDVWCVPEGASP